jgi:hypothetical protein
MCRPGIRNPRNGRAAATTDAGRGQPPAFAAIQGEAATVAHVPILLQVPSVRIGRNYLILR